MSTVTTRLRVMAGPSRAWSQPWFHTAAPKATTTAIVASHQAGVLVERSTAADHTWLASAATATVPATTAASRRGDRTSGAGARRVPPAARSWTQASAATTTSVRRTTDTAPP